MLGEYLTALLVAVLGYVYPVYLCFKVRATRSSR
jgi:receptor expression-enhancing protein 1/2/3/4